MQDKTSLLAATTPQDSSTYHNFLITRKDPNRPDKLLFNVVELMEICKACKQTNKPWTCTHKSYNISGSKSVAKREETLALYPENKKFLALRELFGQAAGGSSGLLSQEGIDQLHSHFVDLDHKAQCIYLSIDPGGGGDGRMGLTAMVDANTIHGPRVVVIFTQ